MALGLDGLAMMASRGLPPVRSHLVLTVPSRFLDPTGRRDRYVDCWAAWYPLKAALRPSAAPPFSHFERGR